MEVVGRGKDGGEYMMSRLLSPHASRYGNTRSVEKPALNLCYGRQFRIPSPQDGLGELPAGTPDLYPLPKESEDSVMGPA